MSELDLELKQIQMEEQILEYEYLEFIRNLNDEEYSEIIKQSKIVVLDIQEDNKIEG